MATPSAKVRDGLSVIHDTAGGLVRFVESFRRFTSLPTPAPQLIGVGDLVADVMKLFEAEGDGPMLSSTVEPDDLMIYADPALIRQVLTNVVKNARQAIMQSGEGREVRIKAWTDGDVVTIEVVTTVRQSLTTWRNRSSCHSSRPRQAAAA